MTDGELQAVVEEFFERRFQDDWEETIGGLFADDAVITMHRERWEGPDAAVGFIGYIEERIDWVRKDYDRWFETDRYVVTQGTLYGVDDAGEEFEGLRYVDIYEIVDGTILRLDVYNDLPAAGLPGWTHED